MTVARPRTRPIVPAVHGKAPSNVVPLRPDAPIPFVPPIHVRALKRAEMDAINAQLAPLAGELRRTHARFRERVLIRYMTAPEFMVMSAIASRTLGWSKVIEVIPLSQFIGGLRDATGAPVMSEGLPAFLGTGLDRKTISKALAALEENGMILRYAFPSGGRETYAYAPASAWLLAVLIHNRGNLGPIPEPIDLSVHYDPADGNYMTSDLERAFAAMLGIGHMPDGIDWPK